MARTTDNRCLSLSPETRIGFIGAGRMAQAMAKGFISAGLVKPEHIIASDPVPVMLETMQELGINATRTNTEVVEKSEIIILAVKPDCVADVLGGIRETVEDKLIVSIAAGITIEFIEQLLPPGTRVVRVMPNTPALVQAAASVVAKGKNAVDADGEVVTQLLQAIGICEMGSEKMLDAVTGLSGSGPAYAFIAIEALADGGVKMGLPRDLSTKLAAQTLLGAAKMVLETGIHPGQLKDQVCSPGGTTIAAVHALEKNGFRAGLIDAVETATNKAKELGS